jgi:hypothetical protein
MEGWLKMRRFIRHLHVGSWRGGIREEYVLWGMRRIPCHRMDWEVHFAFEDTALLTRLLITSSCSSPSDDHVTTSITPTEGYERPFAMYQTIREPRGEMLRKDARGVQGLKKQSGPWVWWAKKWAIRGYFWWNGGVVGHIRETV